MDSLLVNDVCIGNILGTRICQVCWVVYVYKCMTYFVTYPFIKMVASHVPRTVSPAEQKWTLNPRIFDIWPNRLKEVVAHKKNHLAYWLLWNLKVPAEIWDKWRSRKIVVDKADFSFALNHYLPAPFFSVYWYAALKCTRAKLFCAPAVIPLWSVPQVDEQGLAVQT